MIEEVRSWGMERGRGWEDGRRSAEMEGEREGERGMMKSDCV